MQLHVARESWAARQARIAWPTHCCLRLEEPPITLGRRFACLRANERAAATWPREGRRRMMRLRERAAEAGHACSGRKEESEETAGTTLAIANDRAHPPGQPQRGGCGMHVVGVRHAASKPASALWRCKVPHLTELHARRKHASHSSSAQSLLRPLSLPSLRSPHLASLYRSVPSTPNSPR